MNKFEAHNFEQTPHPEQEGVDILTPKKELTKEKPPKFENAEVIEEESREVKKSNKKLKAFFATAALFATSAWGTYDYMKTKPKVDEESLMHGNKVEFTLASKKIEGQEVQFSVQKQKDGTVVLEGIVTGGPRIFNEDKHGNMTNPEGAIIHYELPRTTNIKDLMEELNNNDDPGSIIAEYSSEARLTRFTKLESGGNKPGVHAKEILTIIPSTEKGHSASVTRETFDENHQPHFSKATFSEAEGQVKSIE